MRSTRNLALLLSALAALGPFSVDTYFPSFPAIGEHFGVSQLDVQATLSGYLFALAAMSLFHGALADAFGRRPVLLTALSVYTVSGLACPLAPSFAWLVGLRVVQGLAAGAGMIVGRAVVRDRFEGPDAHRFMAQVTVVSGVAPAVAPIVGGWLHVTLGWRGPFLFLGVLGALLVLACSLALPESLPAEARQSFHPAKLSAAYWQASRNAAFMSLSLAVGAGASGFLLYVATAPDVVMNILGLKETQFGWMFIPLVVGMISGSATSARLAGRISTQRLVRWSFGIMFTGALLNLAANVWMTPRVPWAVAPLALYTFGFCLFAPAATILCLDLMPERRGLASSLQGFLQILGFALVAGALAPLVYGSGARHALGMLALLICNLFGWLGYARFVARAK